MSPSNRRDLLSIQFEQTLATRRNPRRPRRLLTSLLTCVVAVLLAVALYHAGGAG